MNIIKNFIVRKSIDCGAILGQIANNKLFWFQMQQYG